MKNMYSVGDDIFIALAFVSFIVGIGVRILSISQIAFGINYREVLFFSMMCLLFSVALSLYELNQAR